MTEGAKNVLYYRGTVVFCGSIRRQLKHSPSGKQELSRAKTDLRSKIGARPLF